MEEKTQRTTLWKRLGAGAAVGVVVGVAGFFIAWFPGPSYAMGTVMFCLVPLAAGVAIGVVAAPPGRVAITAAVLALLLSLVCLIAMGKEGLLCALLAIGLLVVPLMIGVGIGYLIRRVSARSKGKATPIRLSVVLLMPLTIFAGHRVEMKALAGPRTEVVSTTTYLSAAPSDVWIQIQSLPTVEGRKPILMYIGLPVPQRCVLEGTGVGSKRICYFDHGRIEETVLEWDPPRKMRLSIDRTNMPGRHWLEFESAEYDLVAVANGTRLTRTTTIQSNLYPAWYWRRFERLGVTDEHEYLFSDLARRFSSPSTRQ
ncbi:MAG: hypothetical protein ACLQMT_10085 [Candidatus Acidiferrales bacterium]